MSHHVPVGVIAEDEVVLLRLDRLAEHVGDAGSAHLRHQVVGRDLLGGDEDALFAGVRGLDAAIEEVRDVGVLLGLGGADRKSTRLNSSHLVISYAVFCLKKKKNNDISAITVMLCHSASAI